MRAKCIAGQLAYANAVALAHPKMFGLDVPTSEVLKPDTAPVIEDPYPFVPTSMRHAAEYICRKHDITLNELRGASRSRHYTVARKEFSVICTEKLGKSSPEIGHYLGGRDHTTILYYIGATARGARHSSRVVQ